jgi:GT2 family glycosyltransferase
MELRRPRPVIICASATPVSYQEFDLFVKHAGDRRRIGRIRPGTAAVGLLPAEGEVDLVEVSTGRTVSADIHPARWRDLLAATARTFRRLLRHPRSTWRDLSGGARGVFFWPVRVVHIRSGRAALRESGFQRAHRMGDSLLPGAERRIAEIFQETGADSVSWDFLMAGEGVLRPAATASLIAESDVMDRHIAFRPEAARDATLSARHVHVSEYLGRSQVMQSWTRRRPVPRSDAGASVILPTRDAPDLLRACLDSLQGSLRPADELIVVDHCTRDETALALIRQAEDAGATVCRESGPFNFSRLVNAGARLATRPHLVMLNNDVAGLNADWAAIMAGWLERDGVGAVGVDLRYPDGSRQHTGLTLGADGLPAHLEPGRRTDGPFGLYRLPRPVFAVTGACLGISTGTFREIGGLDEAWPTDFNDIALCLAVRARGLSVMWTPDIAAVHAESASRGRSAVTEWHRADWARLLERHPDLGRSDPFVSPRIDRRRLEWAEDWRLSGYGEAAEHATGRD